MAARYLALAMKPMPAAAGHSVVGELAIATSNDQPRGI